MMLFIAWKIKLYLSSEYTKKRKEMAVVGKMPERCGSKKKSEKCRYCLVYSNIINMTVDRREGSDGENAEI